MEKYRKIKQDLHHMQYTYSAEKPLFSFTKYFTGNFFVRYYVVYLIDRGKYCAVVTPILYVMLHSHSN